MRRADRLFQLVQLLRRYRVTTAARLAGELEVSERTIYRDVRDLISSGVPIEGEAGVGYALPRSFDLPPLMFTRQELEAVSLGVRMVKAWGDDELARSAKSALARIEAVLPRSLVPAVRETALFAPDFHIRPGLREHLATLRHAVSERRRTRILYRRRDGEQSDRTVRPLGLFFWGYAWSLTAWCELREEFRNFRLDRMESLHVTDVVFNDEPGRNLDDYLARTGDD